jgi:S-adenosylmethionine hydrolase
MSVISLTTDFGTQDEYVGVVKGVILGINPNATIVDITHNVAAQDIGEAAHTLAAAFGYFPSGSIHMVVVDPGVGSEREIIGVRLQDHLFLAPNNGVLSRICSGHTIQEMVKVTANRFFLERVSNTFHGRDIFAPVAAHLSLGVELSDLGPQLLKNEFSVLACESPQATPSGQLTGSIITIDRFGNLITNIHRRDIENMMDRGYARELTIKAGKRVLSGLNESYTAVPKGDVLAIIGSRDCLEIAVRDGNAANEMQLGKGDSITVVITTHLKKRE